MFGRAGKLSCFTQPIEGTLEMSILKMATAYRDMGLIPGQFELPPMEQQASMIAKAARDEGTISFDRAQRFVTELLLDAESEAARELLTCDRISELAWTSPENEKPPDASAFLALRGIQLLQGAKSGRGPWPIQTIAAYLWLYRKYGDNREALEKYLKHGALYVDDKYNSRRILNFLLRRPGNALGKGALPERDAFTVSSVFEILRSLGIGTFVRNANYLQWKVELNGYEIDYVLFIEERCLSYLAFRNPSKFHLPVWEMPVQIPTVLLAQRTSLEEDVTVDYIRELVPSP